MFRPNKMRPASSTTFLYAARGRRLRASAESTGARKQEPMITAKHTIRNPRERKCLDEYLSKLRYQ